MTSAETRAFHQRRGLVPLEVLPGLWSAANPCLLEIEALDRGSSARRPGSVPAGSEGGA